MLIYTRKAPPKAPKRRSRAGCLYCKEKKKKCNEQRPQCDRCAERNLHCEYEPVKPRKRKRTSSALAPPTDNPSYDLEPWEPQIFRHDQDQWDITADFEYATPQSYGETSAYDQEGHYDLDEDVEEIIRRQSLTDSTGLVRSRSQYPDLAMIAPSPVASPLLEFNAPLFMEFAEKKSRRSLVDHFCNVLSHLVVFKEDTGNPFRQLVLPLSHASQPVLDALFALSSAHLEYRGVNTDERSLDFHSRALRGLATLIDDRQQSHREQILAAIMLLVYYEVLVERKQSNIVHSHLKAAMTVMKAQTGEPSPTSMFLERAFRFYDVIAALSFGTPPMSSTPAPLSPLNLPVAQFASPLNSVDTLLGMATDLWPIIHRLSYLLEAKRELQAAEASGNTIKATVLRTELESTSHAIELALTNWIPSIPSLPSSPPHDPFELDLDQGADPRLQSILNNAEAYRHAAFVYLYKDIQTYPRRSKKIQYHSKLAVEACERVVEWAGPMSALLWPLFVGSCEAIEMDYREMSRRAFAGTEKRQGMNNIATAWEVVEEVWRRDDMGEELDWRQICVEKGFSIVFG